MKPYRAIIPIILLISLFISPTAQVYAQSNPPVVRAVLFYSPTCPHCQLVINETLPPLMKRYGKQLQIVHVDVTQETGQTLFLAALKKFGVKEGGVPFLVIDNIYLIGSDEIPGKLPGLIESYLAQSGTNWPDIPGLYKVIPQASTSELQVQDSGKANWNDNFSRDPAGNTLAVLVLVGMFVAVAWTMTHFKKIKGRSLNGIGNWIIPVLCAIGLGVAGYLAYVETTQVTAICGPVGDCNTVQQSEYARLFGILPIGILGLIGYVTILIAWGINHFSFKRMADFAALTLLALAVLGTLFSIYLTFLELRWLLQ